MSLKELFSEERAQSEWNSIYLLIVFAIAALALIALVKPMFRQSMKIAKKGV